MLASMLATARPVDELRRAARGELARTLESYDPLDTVAAHIAKAPPTEVGAVNTMRYLDLKLTLAGGILVKVDRASMAVSLEVRPVFLNRDVLSVAGRVPPALLADRREPKKALRAALRDWLPSSLLDRPKQGFAMPLGTWLQRDLQSFATSTHGPIGDLVDKSYLGDLTQAQLSGVPDQTPKLHSLLFLDHWLEKWQ
jgi:asparagine synthase (glutamine-hydrolysing)